MNTSTNKYNFNSGWISGFTQSDGSFGVSFDKRHLKKGTTIVPRLNFQLSQNISELQMFQALQKYLGIGHIVVNKDEVRFVVTSLTQILTVLIPLFDKSPVRDGKLQSYLIFKKVALMMKEKEHLTSEGTVKIIQLAYFMNKTGSKRTEESKQSLLALLPIQSETVEAVKALPTPNLPEMSLDFVTGLIDGDGSFNLSFKTDRRRIVANFTVIQDEASSAVVNELKAFFNCGNVYNLPSAAIRYQVESVDLILNHIIPLLNQVKFNTFKQERYEIFSQACHLIKTKGYKTDENLKVLVDLAYDMNKSGVRRKLTKEEYLKKMIISNK